MEKTDAELVERAQAGDVEAFSELIQRHRHAVARLARSLVPGHDQAQDLTQETFVLAFQHLASLRDGSRVGAWLRRILFNAARQWWRHERQVSFEPLWDDAVDPQLDSQHSSRTAYDRLRQRVRDALDELSPELRTAVLLHYFDGFDYGEAAALLDVPVSTVRGRLYLARRILREEMAELAPPKHKIDRSPADTLEFTLTAMDLAALRGAEMLASRDETRPVLQSICIEPDGSIVSTDTHRMFVYRGSSIRPPSQTLIERSLLAGLAYHPSASEGKLTLTRETAVLTFIDEQDPGFDQRQEATYLKQDSYPEYQKSDSRTVKGRRTAFSPGPVRHTGRGGPFRVVPGRDGAAGKRCRATEGHADAGRCRSDRAPRRCSKSNTAFNAVANGMPVGRRGGGPGTIRAAHGRAEPPLPARLPAGSEPFHGGHSRSAGERAAPSGGSAKRR